MIANAIKDKFINTPDPGLFTRVDSSHPLDLYAGIDDNGRYAFKLRDTFRPYAKIKQVSQIEVGQFTNDGFNTLMFSLLEPALLDLFVVFCDDIISSTIGISESSDGYKIILDRFYLWRKMFSIPKTPLAEPEIMGLIGEISFFKDFLFKRYGKTGALEGWSGQEMTHKDFSYKDGWYEIKTIHDSKYSVGISSLEQLYSKVDGELVIYKLEKMSPAYKGISINTLAKNVLDSLESDMDKELFLSRLKNSGFSFDSSYDEYVYEITSVKRYTVNIDFPKLTRENIIPAVVKINYELNIALLAPFEINE